MSNITHMEPGEAPDDAIEGTASLVVQQTLKRVQATIRPIKEPEKGLDNIILESPRLDKQTAWYALAQYLHNRGGQPMVKLMFLGALMGQKPKYERQGQRHRFQMPDEQGDILATYDVTLIEV